MLRTNGNLAMFGNSNDFLGAGRVDNYIMKLKTKSTIAVIGLVLAYMAIISMAWDTVTLAVSPGANEAAWRDAMAEQWGGRTEVVIEGGRVDVMTDLYAIEIDFARKWHEGFGQALHYANATGKQGIVALIVPEKMSDRMKLKMVMIEDLVNQYDIHLIVLTGEGNK